MAVGAEGRGPRQRERPGSSAPLVPRRGAPRGCGDRMRRAAAAAVVGAESPACRGARAHSAAVASGESSQRSSVSRVVPSVPSLRRAPAVSRDASGPPSGWFRLRSCRRRRARVRCGGAAPAEAAGARALMRPRAGAEPKAPPAVQGGTRPSATSHTHRRRCGLRPAAPGRPGRSPARGRCSRHTAVSKSPCPGGGLRARGVAGLRQGRARRES